MRNSGFQQTLSPRCADCVNLLPSLAERLRVRSSLIVFVLASILPAIVWGSPPPLLPRETVQALADELSGDRAEQTVEALAQFHRIRGSRGYHSAAELVARRARESGLVDVEILAFPADGTIRYGTQLSRPAWDANEGELGEVRGGRELPIASYAAEPMVLAEDSESADVTTTLVDVGAGTREADYSGKDVAGKLVLVASQADAVQDLAIGRFHAAGIVSYVQNQPTAWSGLNPNLIRWGHLNTFSPYETFAFMISLNTARTWQRRLAAGEKISLHAHVEAGQHPGSYEIVTARIRGSDPASQDQELAFACHLDHPKPSANDNASGCATILEVGRTLAKLIAAGKLPAPRRSLRFIWSPEVEGSLTLLTARPDIATRLRAVIYLDMVGGGPATGAVFHLTRGPLSLPSFIHDIGWSLAAWLNYETYDFAAHGKAEFPLVAPRGGLEPLLADSTPYDTGSDQDVYQDSSFAIPTIYLRDWPDRYIHTNLDLPANVDPTKLGRAALLTAASGYFLANLSARDTAAVDDAIAFGTLTRTATAMQRGQSAEGAHRLALTQEHAVRASLRAFLGEPSKLAPYTKAKSSRDADAVFRRVPEVKGPMQVFGYDYFAEHARVAGLATPRLLDYRGAWGGGDEYAYELLNLTDGRHTAQQLVDQLSEEYGPVPLELVIEYLRALERIGVLQRM